MLRSLVVAGALLIGVSAVMAQDAAKDAQTLMKATGKSAGALAAISKGEKPYDQAAVDAVFAQFEETAKKLPTLFPASHEGREARRRLPDLAEDLGRQGRLRRAHRELRQDRR